MKIKIGIAPIAWSNDDMPELGGDTPIETCLDEAHSIGFTGIELGGKFPRNQGTIRFLLKKFKLELPGGWYGSKLRERSIEDEWIAMKDQINLLKYLNSSVFVFADISGSIQAESNISLVNRPKIDNIELKDYCKKISEISNRLDDVGLPMSFHQHMGTIIQTEKDVEKFLEHTNEKTFLLYDTGHLLFAKVDYLYILKKYRSRINHIHCKDIRKNILNISLAKNLSFRDSFLEGVFTVPGDGCIDYESIIKILYENKYKDWLIIEAEQDPKKANPYKYSKKGFNFLKNILVKIGYRI